MSKPYYQQPDAALRDWAQTASTQITATPSAFHVTAQNASDFAALVSTFDTSLTAWQNPATRSPVTFQTKQADRALLIDGAKFIVNTINSNPLTTDAQRRSLGFPIRKTPTPVPVPAWQPNFDNVKMEGRSFYATVHGPNPGKRGKPAAVQGISVFQFVGEQPSMDVNEWTFVTSTTKMEVNFDFDAALTPGTKVWVTCFFYNSKAESGPAATPVSAYIQYGGLQKAA